MQLLVLAPADMTGILILCVSTTGLNILERSRLSPMLHIASLDAALSPLQVPSKRITLLQIGDLDKRD